MRDQHRAIVQQLNRECRLFDAFDRIPFSRRLTAQRIIESRALTMAARIYFGRKSARLLIHRRGRFLSIRRWRRSS